MSDLIQICGLEVWACLGLTEKEREFPQRLLMNVTLSVSSTSKAAREDDIHETVDYALVWQTIEKTCQERQRVRRF